MGHSEEIKDQLKAKLREIHERLVDENNALSEQLCRKFLCDTYAFIDRKLKNQEISFIDFIEGDLKLFKSYYLENTPQGPRREALLHEFVASAIAEGAEFFHRTLSNELDIQKSLSDERARHLEAQLKEIK